MSERPKVRYEYWKADPVAGKKCWALYRLNEIGMSSWVATYYSEEAAASARALLRHLSQFEKVHLDESL